MGLGAGGVSFDAVGGVVGPWCSSLLLSSVLGGFGWVSMMWRGYGAHCVLTWACVGRVAPMSIVTTRIEPR